MALPVTIVSDIGLPGHHPPEASPRNQFYAVVRADADELDVYKATDPTSSFSVQDSGNGPVHAGTLVGYSCIQDGDIIHIVAWSTATYEYYTFNTATDVWAIDELIETPKNAPTFPWASIAVRSDGDVIVAYAGDTDQVMGGKKERVDYARREGGTWTAGVALDAGGDVHYGNPNVVLGTNDGMHFIWQTTTVTTDPPTSWASAEGRTLDSGNSLSTLATHANATFSGLLGYQLMLSYDDAGTQRVHAVGFKENQRPQCNFTNSREDGSDNLEFINSGHNDLTTDCFYNGEISIVSAIHLDGELHALFSGGGTDGVDQDLYYFSSINLGDTYINEAEEIDAITVNFISANIYVRDCNFVLAYIYDDGGVQKYNEKILLAVEPQHQMML